MHFSHKLIFLVLFFPLCAGGTENQTDKKYLDSALRREGNPENGKKIFKDKRALCSECHSIDGQSDSIGPDLSAAGDKFSRADLILSVMNPSANIMAGYGTTVIETKDQSTFMGILKSVSDKEITLSNLGERKKVIQKTDIKKQSTSSVSLMPASLHAQLEVNEFTDLISFLESLKQPITKGLSKKGTPLKIKQIKKPITIEPFFGKNLDFEKPVWFGEHPIINDSYIIVEKSRALVSLLEKSEKGIEKQSTFLAIPEEVYVTNDEGLLGFAFHPNFEKNRRYFFMHEVRDGNYRGMVIGERKASVNLRKDSGAPTKEILEFEVATEFHHGGGIEFGPDGYLYIGMGDGGPQEDPLGNAQNLNSFSGKILRININKKENGKMYSIPENNPFIKNPNKIALKEIYAYGLRQPWRFSFDSKTKDLWVGDVGQNRFEEINIVRSGENLGWNIYEGYELFSTKFKKDTEKLINPIISFRRSHGVSITGGYVIRSANEEKDSYEGIYICADYQSKKIWGIKQVDRKLKMIRQIGDCPDRIVSFGLDNSRNIFAIGYDKGIIYKMDFSESVFE